MQPKYFDQAPPAHPVYHSDPIPPPLSSAERQAFPTRAGKATINNNSMVGDTKFCHRCQSETPNINKSKVSGVTIAWCFFLVFTTGGILAFLPFCMDDCKDVEVICEKCQESKAIVEASCC